MTVAPLPPAVVKFIVRRADTDVVIVDPLTDGATVDLFALCGGVTCQVNIEAVPSVSPIESATMLLSGATTRTRTDSTSPYTMQGNNGGDYVGFPINRGVHTFTATPFSADNAGGTVGTPLAVTFTVVLAPVITSTPVTTATLGNLYTYNVNAQPLAAGLTFSLTQVPPADRGVMTIDAGTGRISWTPAIPDPTVPNPTLSYSNQVTVRVTDNQGRFTEQTFTIVVSPKAEAITVTEALFRNPPGNNNADASWTINGTSSVNAGNCTGLPNVCGNLTIYRVRGAGVLAIGTATVLPNGQWSFTELPANPVASQAQGDTIRVRSLTGGVVNSAITFTVVLGPVITSTAPVTTATLGDLYTYDVNATPVANGLTFSLTQVPPADRGDMTIDAGTGRISWTPAIPDPTVPNPTLSYSNQVTVRVTDNQGRFTEQTFTIVVSPKAEAITVTEALFRNPPGNNNADASWTVNGTSSVNAGNCTGLPNVCGNLTIYRVRGAGVLAIGTASVDPTTGAWSFTELPADPVASQAQGDTIRVRSLTGGVINGAITFDLN